MAETLKRHMLTRLKKKMTPALIQSRKNSQHQMVRDKYMIFSGSEENFVRNGAWVLEESIALFHGKANPVRYLSVVDLNSMNVEPLPCYEDCDYNLYQGSWEGRAVLVKSGRVNSYNDEYLLREIVIATQMATHNNAHKILGCCLETDLPVVVYEWMPPETLHHRIFLNDTNQSKAVLEWKDRLRIAWEISHVVAYLNTAFPRSIIHKHLKPSNVFLDQHNAAKLGDFSLSVSIPEDKEFVEDTVITGTVGYIDPEYNSSAKVAKSTDVYSFGMLLLVLLTGKSPIFKEGFFEETSLDSWVQDRIENDSINGIVDPTITRNEATSIQDIQLRAFAQLALRCIIGQRDDRPTMVEVATELKNMITSPEFIPTATNFQENGLYRIFYGSEKYFTQNSALVHKESISLFNDSVHPIRYFSVHELNNMNVEIDRVFRYFYRGTWEGKAVLIRMSNCGFREIVVATQLVTHNNVQKLLGCCLETKLPVLVYEWVAAETLEDRILRKDENHCRLPPLEWKDRLRIAWEISDVVSYLQTAFPKPITHKIFTLNNVFLDQDNTTKLSNPAECTTDVKSLGMLILVLLTGKYEVANLVNNKTLGDILEIIDPVIVKNRVATTELRASIELALRCTNGHLHLGSRPIMEEIAIELNNIIRSHESIPSTSTFQGRNIHRICNGSGENFMQFKSLVLQESFSLFHDPVNPIQYFSVHELNSMNVEHDQIFPYCYQGSWDGRAILAKLQNAVTIEIQSSILREIVVATKTATHNNVQKLLGCCLETKIPILVYEWVASETLKDRILPMYESQRKLPPLSWKDRLRIAWEISDVVFYLHTAFPRPIIHGILELENILLDQNGSVKLSNFNHFISTLKGGEFGKDCRIETIGGLMVPDNFKGCSLAECADVYSFGLLFLVLLTGKNSSFPFTSTREPTSTNLIHWVIKALRMDRISVIIDPAINKNEVTAIELRAALGLALRCTTSLEGCRPTMADVATELKCMICSHDSISSLVQ